MAVSLLFHLIRVWLIKNSIWTSWQNSYLNTNTLTHGHTGLSATLFLPQTSAGSSAQSLNPVAVVTLPLYTMAWWLHNVFLLVQFVAHTTAEWAGSTVSCPPTHHSMLMKSLTSPGSFHTESYRTAESLRAFGCCLAAKATSFDFWVDV